MKFWHIVLVISACYLIQVSASISFYNHPFYKYLYPFHKSSITAHGQANSEKPIVQKIIKLKISNPKHENDHLNLVILP